MLNPFTEVAHGDSTDVALAEGANNGDRAALRGGTNGPVALDSRTH
jgi:hypothetical protein